MDDLRYTSDAYHAVESVVLPQAEMIDVEEQVQLFESLQPMMADVGIDALGFELEDYPLLDSRRCVAGIEHCVHELCHASLLDIRPTIEGELAEDVADALTDRIRPVRYKPTAKMKYFAIANERRTWALELHVLRALHIRLFEHTEMLFDVIESAICREAVTAAQREAARFNTSLLAEDIPDPRLIPHRDRILAFMRTPWPRKR